MSLQSRVFYASRKGNKAAAKRSLSTALAAALVLFFVNASAGSPTDGLPVKNITAPRLAAEEAVFEYFTGNRLRASILASGGNDDGQSGEPLLSAIKMLSDIKLIRADAGSVEAAYAASPLSPDVLDSFYRSGDPYALEEAAKAQGRPAASYYGALAAYTRGDIAKARALLEVVDKNSPYHPYARILLAQIQVKYNAFNTALSTLNAVIDRASSQSVEATDLALMYKGYLLYELGRYKDAYAAFSKIESPVYRIEALANAAHSAARAGDCSAALEHIEDIGALNQLGGFGQELLITKASCLGKIGKKAQAVRLITETIKTLNALTDGYDKIYATKTLPKELDEVLSTTAMASQDALFTRDTVDAKAVAEALRIETASSDPGEMKEAASYYTAAVELESTFKNEITRLDYAMHAISARRLALETWFEKNRSGSASARDRLEYLRDSVYESSPDNTFSLRKHGFDDGVVAGIESKWSGALNRRLSEAEKRIINMILLDGDEGVSYLNNIQYNQLLYLMTINKPSGGRKPTAERIVTDLDTLLHGETLPGEFNMPTLDNRIRATLSSDAKALKKLAELKALAEGNLEKTAELKKAALDIAKAVVLRRATLLRFEIRGTNAKARKVLESMATSEEASR